MMEYTPWWMEQAGADPDAYVAGLIGYQHVYDMPAGDRLRSPSLDARFAAPREAAEVACFARYTRRLSRSDKGWTRPIGHQHAPPTP
jgi:hypothetical protein